MSVLPSPAVLADAEGHQPLGALQAALRRIDGWGPGAWREVHGCWRLGRRALLVIEDAHPEQNATLRGFDEVELRLLCHCPGLLRLAGNDAGTQAALADGLLRRIHSDFDLPGCGVPMRLWQPGPQVRPSNACLFAAPWAGAATHLCLRLRAVLPLAGMTCDPRPFRRLLRQFAALAAWLDRAHRDAAIRRHVKSVQVQDALRKSLAAHRLVSFIADGSRLVPGGLPLKAPPAWRVKIKLGKLGTHRGLGIPRGVTALTGAAYHGKSTLLAAIAAGRENHAPGTGLERVVSESSALLIQAEDGRRIAPSDLSAHWPSLPGGGSSAAFTTERASGATSMAASMQQGLAAGCRLLLADEDSAAANFLHVDPPLRAAFGTQASGTTLCDAAPHLAAAGVSVLLAVGSSSLVLRVADRALRLDGYHLRDATSLLRRVGGNGRAKARRVSPWAIPTRHLLGPAELLYGERHFVHVDAREVERPLVNGQPLDLRRCGWVLDAALVRGAIFAAAWCCRTAGRAGPQGISMQSLTEAYTALCAQGPSALDPFHTSTLALPPWQLVVSVVERLANVDLRG